MSYCPDCAEKDKLIREQRDEIARLTGKMCLVCGRSEPCNEAPEACTFDPHPIDAARAFLRRAEQAEAERDALVKGVSIKIPTVTMEQEIQAHIVRATASLRAERDAAMKDAERYRFWRKHYSSRFVIVLAPGLVCGTDLKFDATRPKVEAAGPDYERKVDAAIDAAMKAKP